jgi:7-cyano-7-deazaguanine synthase in queuosine biosynthesis
MPLIESEIAHQVCRFETSIEALLKENKNKSINIMWSGGCDSTLILYWLLEWLKNLNDDRIINAYSFHHNQLNDNKMDWERQKRNRFIMWAEDKGFNNKIVHREISLGKDIITVGPASCCQPAIWVSQIIPIVPHDGLLFAGYHHGDDFFSYEIFGNWLKAFVSMNNLFGKNIRFVAPLAQHSKNEIIKLIKNIDGLYNNTWWCEGVSTDGKPCGRCLPCEAHESALMHYNKNKALEVQVATDIKKELETDKKVEDKPLDNIEIDKIIKAVNADPELAKLVAKAAG